MGDKYAAGMQQGLVTTVDGSTGTDGVGELTSATSVRPRIYDIIFSHGSLPADQIVRWEVPRITASGSGSAIVENALDPGAPAADVIGEEEIATTGPTVTANSQMLDFDLNQRATFRWVAAPGGEIVLPASAGTGCFFNASSTNYAGIARVTVHWEE